MEWLWSCMLIPLKGALGLSLWCLFLACIAGFVGLCMEIWGAFFDPKNGPRVY